MTYEEEKAVELLTSKNTDMQPLGLWLLVCFGWSPSAIAQAYVKWCREKNYRYILWNNKEYPSNHWKNRIILSGETSKFYLDKNSWVQFYQHNSYGLGFESFKIYLIYCINGNVIKIKIGNDFFLKPVVLRFYLAKVLRKYIQYVETK